MNENLPPPTPEEPKPTPVLPEAPKPSRPLNPWQATGLGFLLFIISAALCFITPFFGLFGFVVAFGCLFIPGYRYIFAGYILTVGVLLLGTIIYCSTQPFDMK